MIFEYLGRFATRYRIPIIVAWVAAAAIVTLVAPDMAAVVSSDMADFLPGDAPFKRANALYEELFPEDNAAGSSVIVFDARQSAEGVLNPDASSFEAQLDTEAGRFIRAFTGWATSGEAPEVPRHGDLAHPVPGAGRAVGGGRGERRPASDQQGRSGARQHDRNRHRAASYRGHAGD
ncbi:MAG: hypothetical protein M5U29_18395 [Anaerolineae bacterium]|nr:hypothetical protein [Anaerolineae bacterium]